MTVHSPVCVTKIYTRRFLPCEGQFQFVQWLVASLLTWHSLHRKTRATRGNLTLHRYQCHNEIHYIGKLCILQVLFYFFFAFFFWESCSAFCGRWSQMKGKIDFLQISVIFIKENDTFPQSKRIPGLPGLRHFTYISLHFHLCIDYFRQILYTYFVST